MQSVKLDLTKWECYHRANVAEINEGVWLALSSTARTWPLRRTSLWFLGSVSFSSFKEQQPESIWLGMSRTFLHGWQLRGCSSDVIWAPAKVSELIQKHAARDRDRGDSGQEERGKKKRCCVHLEQQRDCQARTGTLFDFLTGPKMIKYSLMLDSVKVGHKPLHHSTA